jgi:hypothetical protein
VVVNRLLVTWKEQQKSAAPETLEDSEEEVLDDKSSEFE